MFVPQVAKFVMVFVSTFRRMSEIAGNAKSLALRINLFVKRVFARRSAVNLAVIAAQIRCRIEPIAEPATIHVRLVRNVARALVLM